MVDALDLCYTKSHVDTFVIISGDSDFSPLVSKLRENAKRVIGVGVKQSCSDLLIANCDEFIYYDDLVRDATAQRRENREAAPRRTPEEESNRREKLEARKTKAVELAAATFADLIADRGETERVWASVLKEVIKRRNPGFNETYLASAVSVICWKKQPIVVWSVLVGMKNQGVCDACASADNGAASRGKKHAGTGCHRTCCGQHRK